MTEREKGVLKEKDARRKNDGKREGREREKEEGGKKTNLKY
jgi:hypothetical protein